MIFFRKAQRPGTKAFDYQIGWFNDAPPPKARSGDRPADERMVELLSRVFSATAIVPEGPGDSPGNDLLQIADSYTSTKLVQDSDGDQVQITNSVWDVRAFADAVHPTGADYYYVLQETDFVWGANRATNPLTGYPDAFTVALSWAVLNGVPTLLQPSPASTECTVSTTSSMSWNIGGSAGWNATQGLDAALTGGVGVSNSTTVNCPQIKIINQSDPAAGQPKWVENMPAPSMLPWTFTFYNQWVWQVPFTIYYPGQGNVTIASKGGWGFLGPFCQSANNCPSLETQFGMVVPLPFGQTFALQTPAVLSVSPTCVNAGDTFVINGTGFYPSLVTGVVIDGQSLPATQYTTTSDTAITVVAPDESAEAAPVAVQTTQGISPNPVTIEISVIDICAS